MRFIPKNFGKFKRDKVVRSLGKLNEVIISIFNRFSRALCAISVLTHGKLEKKVKRLKEKPSQEVVTAMESTGAKDETAAIQCLKSKKLYEEQIEPVGNLKLRIQDQMIMLEGGEAAAWAVDALKTGKAAMKAICIRNVDDVIYDINEQKESMKQMLEVVATPSGAAALFDEDDLKAELAKLKGAE